MNSATPIPNDAIGNDFPPGSIKTPTVAIDWFRSAPWWRLLSSVVNVSWRASHVLLCCVGLIATELLEIASRFCFQLEVVQDTSWIQSRSPFFPLPNLGSSLAIPPASDYLQVWNLFLTPFRVWLEAPTLRGTAYAFATLLGNIAIWSLVGGCLVRRTVLESGASSPAPWTDTFLLVRQRWQSIAWSLVMPTCAACMIALIPLLLGFVSNIPWIGSWIAGLAMIPMIVFSLAIGWCIAITLLGFPLAISAIVTEKRADAFDGVSRSAAYTFQRPVLLFFLVAIAELMSLVSGDVFALIVGTGYGVIDRTFDIGSYGSVSELGGFPVWILQGIVPLLLSAFSLSFFWSVGAAIYLLLRKEVDHAEFDLVDWNEPTRSVATPQAVPRIESSSTDVD